jgi:hypothetical protein
MRVNIIAAYRLANACLNFLANRGRFARCMDWFMCLHTALEAVTNAATKAAFNVSLGIVFQNHPFGSRSDNRERAIAAFQADLVYRTPEAAPLAYAMTQRNLGIAHEDSGDLRAAVACWREAERYYRLMEMVENADMVLAWIGEVDGGG